MLIPTMIVYLGYIIMPVLISFYYSLTEYTGIGTAKFIGLDNFSRLWEDSLFWISLKIRWLFLRSLCCCCCRDLSFSL